MEKKIIRYLSIYLEIADIGVDFLSKDLLDEIVYQNLVISFRESSGLSSKEYFINENQKTKRLIVSKWTEQTGYQKWQSHPLAKKYIDLRDDYNRRKSIISCHIAGLTDIFI
jgi:quinol monooxygenase YgiN